MCGNERIIGRPAEGRSGEQRAVCLAFRGSRLVFARREWRRPLMGHRRRQGSDDADRHCQHGRAALEEERDPRDDAVAGRVRAGAGEVGDSADFAQALKASLETVDAAQKSSAELSQRFQVGDPKVTLEETMVAMAKANLSFQQMVQVRNKVISAYHDIMNMPV